MAQTMPIEQTGLSLFEQAPSPARGECAAAVYASFRFGLTLSVCLAAYVVLVATRTLVFGAHMGGWTCDYVHSFELAPMIAGCLLAAVPLLRSLDSAADVTGVPVVPGDRGAGFEQPNAVFLYLIVESVYGCRENALRSAAVYLSGIIRGQVTRLWIFLMPFVQVVAAEFCGRFRPYVYRVVLAGAIPQAAITAAMVGWVR
jgi:hypothetical protein